MVQRLMQAVLGLLVLAGIFFLHWYEPSRWPPLAINLLHSLHGPGFALLSVAVFWLLRGRFDGLSRYVAAGLVTFALGMATEASQIPTERAPQIRDLVVNALGVVSGLGVLFLFDRQAQASLLGAYRALVAAICIGAMSVAILPTLWLTYALAAQYRAVPGLLTFEHRWEKPTYTQPGSQPPDLLPPPAGWPAGGTTIGHVFEYGKWGILLNLRPYPDWRGYSRVSFVAASATGRAGDVGIAIRDLPPDQYSEANRFYKTLVVNTEPRIFSISFEDIAQANVNRAFDFAHVDALIFSAATPGDNIVLLIDDIRLE